MKGEERFLIMTPQGFKAKVAAMAQKNNRTMQREGLVLLEEAVAAREAEAKKRERATTLRPVISGLGGISGTGEGSKP